MVEQKLIIGLSHALESIDSLSVQSITAIPGDLLAMGENTQMVPGDLSAMGKNTQIVPGDLLARYSGTMHHAKEFLWPRTVPC